MVDFIFSMILWIFRLNHELYMNFCNVLETCTLQYQRKSFSVMCIIRTSIFSLRTLKNFRACQTTHGSINLQPSITFRIETSHFIEMTVRKHFEKNCQVYFSSFILIKFTVINLQEKGISIRLFGRALHLYGASFKWFLLNSINTMYCISALLLWFAFASSLKT